MRTLLFYCRTLNSRSTELTPLPPPWSVQSPQEIFFHPLDLFSLPRIFFNHSPGIWKWMGVSLADIILRAEHLIIWFAEFCIYPLVFSTMIHFFLQLWCPLYQILSGYSLHRVYHLHSLHRWYTLYCIYSIVSCAWERVGWDWICYLTLRNERRTWGLWLFIKIFNQVSYS